MRKVIAVVIASAALLAAAPSLAQDRTANSFGGASFEAVPQGYGSLGYGSPGYSSQGYGTPVIRQFRAPAGRRGMITIRTPRESGASKRS